MRFSIIIPTYNRPELLQRTLTGLAQQTVPACDLEVVVVDDGSAPGPWLPAGAEPPLPVTRLEQHKEGPTIARNRGAAASQGDVLVFIDDDICIAERTLELLAAVCEHERRVVALGTLVIPASHQLSTYARVSALGDKAVANGQASHDVPFTDCKTGLLAIRRADFESLGGFRDPSGGWPNWDDIDFGYRAHLAGFRFVRSPQALGEHWDYTLADLATACGRWQRASRSAVRLFETHPGIRPHIPMFYDKSPVTRRDPPPLKLRKVARRVMAAPGLVRSLEWITRLVEGHYPAPALLQPLYRWIIGSYIYVGFQEGLKDHRV